MSKPHYTVSCTRTDDGKKVWYCHCTETPSIPVFGSIGTKSHAVAVAKTYNRSIGYTE